MTNYFLPNEIISIKSIFLMNELASLLDSIFSKKMKEIYGLCLFESDATNVYILINSYFLTKSRLLCRQCILFCFHSFLGGNVFFSFVFYFFGGFLEVGCLV